MRLGRLWLSFFLFAAANAPASPSEMPPPFRGASLERRCEALRSFFRWFGGELAAPVLNSGSCGEGSGLGGAHYTFDFKMTNARKTHAYRLDFSLEDASSQISLCDADSVPVQCPPSLSGDLGFYDAKAVELLPTLTAWINAKSSPPTIYGKDYDGFVADIISAEEEFPLDEGGKIPPLKLRFVAGADRKTGQVRFTSPVAAEFLRCLQCRDIACLNEEVRYRFDDRFLALSRRDFTAGWLIEVLKPLGKAAGTWKFVCGVSRYSLESLPAKHP